MTLEINLTDLIERFFVERLLNQKQVSPHTISSYRDTFQLLFRYVFKTLKKLPSEIVLNDLNADFISAFLIDLEKNRGISARSRNVRLAAIRSFFQFISFKEPQAGAVINQVLAIPNKRSKKKMVTFLSDAEVEEVLSVVEQQSWFGRRDKALITVAIETGMRLSELTQLRWDNVNFGPSAHIKCTGKGRKGSSLNNFPNS